MLSKKMTAGFNAQLAFGLYARHLYLAMGAWLRGEGRTGAAAWMKGRSRREAVHADKLYDHILSRGGQVRLGAVESPPSKWNSPLEVFEAAHAHEQKAASLVDNLMGLARAEHDYASELFLGWFVAERAKAEAAGLEAARQYRLAAGQEGALFIIDQRLGKEA